MKARSVGNSIAFVVLIIGIVLGFYYRQQIVDYVNASKYQPSAAVSHVMQSSYLSDKGQQLFKASTPDIENAQEFNTHCRKTEKTSAVLGCYTKQKIYLYDVKNPELKGVVEVTAAHELLHAVYERLYPWEKKALDEQLRVQYKQLSNDQAFAKRMSVYDGISEEERINELHSVFGTEVAQLSPELEAHYAHYFTNRSELVKLYASYETVFKRLEKESNELSASLNALVNDMNKRIDIYNTRSSRLSTQIASFNERAAAGSFASRSDFAIERARLVAESHDIEQEYETLNTMKQTYDKDKKRLDDIALHMEDLNKSIDSRIAPGPKIE